MELSVVTGSAISLVACWAYSQALTEGAPDLANFDGLLRGNWTNDMVCMVQFLAFQLLTAAESTWMIWLCLDILQVCKRTSRPCIVIFQVSPSVFPILVS